MKTHRWSRLVLLLWATVACGSGEKVTPARPLPVDLTLGKPIAEIRAGMRKRFGSDEGPEAPDQHGHRSVSYILEVPESGVGINIRYAYRLSDGAVWGIIVAHDGRLFTGNLGAISLTDSLDDIIEKLGKPIARREEAPVIDTFWWETPDHGYRVNAYSEEYGSNRPGDVDVLEVWRRDLAPREYDAERSAP